MSSVDIIDLCSDDETEVVDVRDVKPILPLQSYQGHLVGNISNNTSVYRDTYIKREIEECRGPNRTSSLSSSANGDRLASSSTFPPVPICRQFWRSGEYEVAQSIIPPSQSGRNRLRINPRFLHSNATSHKWAFGAIAELLDNAIDEVEKGATYVRVDKFTNPLNANPALLIQDDGGGMNPESLRRCMSFGFSEKQSGSSIGEYGNGFKTSTMRLGADVITFSRCMKNRILTQSVGLLSYTFLVQTGCDDIVVPTVDYEFDPLIKSFKRSGQFGERQFSSNLSAILKWSPFSTEAELLKQFDEVGRHGTRIIIFNLWLNDDGHTEIDFDSDQKDILISGENKKGKNTLEHMLTEKYIASRIQYSLRAYTSILYLRIPENFRIVLRGSVVEPHFVANDLIYRECILYKPQIAGMSETVVFTTIGFLEGAPNVNIHGFNVYHKNRLILPFWKVATNSYGKGRGVVGILEANFIKPTHDKQDFEKSNVYQKLENRLKEMTYEYWDLHCHLVGYDNKKHPKVKMPPAPSFHMPQVRKPNPTQEVKVEYDALATSKQLTIQRLPSEESTEHIVNSQSRLPEKRKGEKELTRTEGLKICKVTSQAESGMKQKGCVSEEKLKEIRAMLKENKKLRQQCFEHEKMEKQLTVKAQRLRSNLLSAQLVYKNLQIELQSMDVKIEK